MKRMKRIAWAAIMSLTIGCHAESEKASEKIVATTGNCDISADTVATLGDNTLPFLRHDKGAAIENFYAALHICLLSEHAEKQRVADPDRLRYDLRKELFEIAVDEAMRQFSVSLSEEEISAYLREHRECYDESEKFTFVRLLTHTKEQAQRLRMVYMLSRAAAQPSDEYHFFEEFAGKFSEKKKYYPKLYEFDAQSPGACEEGMKALRFSYERALPSPPYRCEQQGYAVSLVVEHKPATVRSAQEARERAIDALTKISREKQREAWIKNF